MSSWQFEALCAQADPEAWHPTVGESTTYAVRICGRCPVREPCLADALAVDSRLAGDPSGVRGGKTATQRRLMLKQRKATAAAV